MREALAEVMFPHLGLGDAEYDRWAENWLSRYGGETSYTVVSSLYKNEGDIRQRWKDDLGFAIDPVHIGDGPAPLGAIKDLKSLPYLTVDVARVLQGFPRAWQFAGKADRQFYQIGNAFPPQMSKAIGIAIASALSARLPNSIDAPPLVPFDESLIGVKPTKVPRLILNAMTMEDVDDLKERYGRQFRDYKKLRAQVLKSRRARKREMREYLEYRRRKLEQRVETIGTSDPPCS